MKLLRWCKANAMPAKPVAKIAAGAAVAAGSQLTQKGLKYLQNKKNTKKQAR